MAAAVAVLAGPATIGRADDAAPLERGAAADERAIRVAPPARQVTIIAGGDVLTERRVRDAAARHAAGSAERFDFGPMFEPVAGTIRAADLAICNQELPIGVPGASVGFLGRSAFGGSRLRSPYELAAGLAEAGFDRCSTATNHSLDDGTSGIATTIEALDAAGISTTGTARTPGEATIDLVDTGQATVAHLSWTRSLNDPAPADAWRVNVRPSAQRIVADARAARRSGADVVVLSLHIGTELLDGPTASDRAFVSTIAASGQVNAVFVHGPHVVQPVERIGATAVWWSLGNFVSEMGPPSVGRYASPRTSDGLLADVRLIQRPNGSWQLSASSIAICNDSVDRTVRRPTTELGRGVADPRVRAELEACLARTRRVVPDAR